MIAGVNHTPDDFPDPDDVIYWHMSFWLDDEGNEHCNESFDTDKYKEDVDKWFKRWYEEWSRNIA